MAKRESETLVPSRLVDEYKTAMRHVASQVAVVTFPTEAGRNGITCTAICSASTEPPALVVSINRSTEACDAIAKAGVFVVNHLNEEQSEIARQFSSSGNAQQRFSVGFWSVGETGAPILGAATANFECRVEKVMEFGEHRMFVGTVVSVQIDDGSALLYRDGFFRRLVVE
ncbi:MAG TPA: hypothetical protein DEO85_05755 [Maritimibacter sp.]|nr:hypothetical protein [Maritimibacter sp.]